MKDQKDIQKLAYDIFEKNGRVHGRDLEHWLEAERIVRARKTDVQAAANEAAATKKRVVERSDTRRHEAKKTGKAVARKSK
ncbi:MAG TPA: DUF2934 domain-containing protein [Thermodesulfovibrionales bacterium]|nr:DUF2934 domain-containing protein [Thermodesulfovibrionales bacterium]